MPTLSFTTYAQHVKHNVALAKTAYARHEIRKAWNDGDRWLLQCKYPDDAWDWNMSTEIICTHNGKIVLEGDAPACTFGYYSDSRSFEGRIRWIGMHPFDSYVLEKAGIGMQNYPVTEWCAAVCLGQVETLLAEDPAQSGLKGRDREVLENSRDYIGYDGPEAWWAQLSDGIDLWEWVGNYGNVPTINPIYAHAALARLCAIWDAK